MQDPGKASKSSRVKLWLYKNTEPTGKQFIIFQGRLRRVLAFRVKAAGLKQEAVEEVSNEQDKTHNLLRAHCQNEGKLLVVVDRSAKGLNPSRLFPSIIKYLILLNTRCGLLKRIS